MRGHAVQLFYFVLKAGRETVPDTEGQELADETAARLHAISVARQLMRNREASTRNWSIQVCDDYLQPQFEVFFAEADVALDHLPAHLQQTVKNTARMVGAFNSAIAAMQATLN